MKVERWDVVHQDLPLFISLAFYVKGCQLKCEGCHSPELWHLKGGIELTLYLLDSLLTKYEGMIDAVIFYGGEWDKALPTYLKHIQSKKLKTCLFTGESDVSLDIKASLDYLKVGKYVKALGGLDSLNTNQQLIEMSSGTILNDLYRRVE